MGGRHKDRSGSSVCVKTGSAGVRQHGCDSHANAGGSWAKYASPVNTHFFSLTGSKKANHTALDEDRVNEGTEVP